MKTVCGAVCTDYLPENETVTGDNQEQRGITNYIDACVHWAHSLT